MRKLKKYMISCLLAVICLSMVVCGTARAEKVRLTLWHVYHGFEAQPLLNTIKAFNATHANIKIEASSIPGIMPKLLAACAAGNPPEIYCAWGYTDTADLGLRGVFRPLEDLAEAKGLALEELIVPHFFQQCVFRDHVYMVPQHGCIYGMYYNKRLFKEAGIEEPPKTIEELTLYNEKLTKFDSEGNLIQIGFHWDDIGNQWTHDLFARHFGGSIFNREKKRYEFDEGALKAWTWAQNIVKKVGVDKYVKMAGGFGDWGTGGTGFLSERTAMLHQGPWMQEHIQEFTPDMDYGWAPWPVAEEMLDQLYPLAQVVCDAIAIPKNTKHPEEAFEFLAWFMSWEGQVAYNKGPNPLGTLSPYKYVYDGKFWKEITIKYPFMKALYKQLVTGNNYFDEFYLVHSLWEKAGATRQALLRMQLTPKEALTKLCNEMNELLKRYLR